MASEPPVQVARALALDGDPTRIASFYDEWAARYDHEVGGDEYRAPDVATALVGAVGERIDGLSVEDRPAIVDAGCGTGLVGERLVAAGYETVDGFDLSHEMVREARRRGCYRQLWGGVDMSEPMSIAPPGTYDLAVSVGVFTPGHVPASALGHLVTLVRAGGAAIVSTRHRYVTEARFDQELRREAAAGRVELLEHVASAPYSVDDTAQYWVLGVR